MLQQLKQTQKANEKRYKLQSLSTRRSHLRNHGWLLHQNIFQQHLQHYTLYNIHERFLHLHKTKTENRKNITFLDLV